MVLNTVKDNICVNQIIGQKVENIMVEGDMIVPDIKPDILNIISSSGNVCIYKKEVLDGKIRIDGSVNVYIVYLADNEMNNVRSLNTVLDFTSILDFENCKTGMSLDEDINIKNIECNIINERKLGIKVFLNSDVKIYSNENIEVINEILDVNNIQKLENELEINSLIGNGSTKVYAKDNIAIDGIDNLVEILKVNLKIINSETKISHNKILAKSDVEFKIMYLTDDNRINTVINKIPIAGFIDMENVKDSHICNTQYKLKNLIIKPNNIEEHSIYAEAEIEILCFTYEKKKLMLMQDLYSTNMQLSFNDKNIEARAYKDIIKETLLVKEKFNLESNSKIYDTEIKAYIFSTKIQNGMVYYDGEMELNYIYGNLDFNQLKTGNVKFPFNYSIALPNFDNDIIETNIDAKDISIIMLPGDIVELNINLEFVINMYKDEKLHIIQEISAEDNPKYNNYSMVIYYIKQGDTLWNIAKRFNSTIEEIMKINEIDSDNINIGMQLFIPRYVIK